MTKEIICGIYRIKNELNNKYYVGQSIDIEERWNEHIRDLEKQRHKNKHLQHSWNKYGKENFTFAILEECNVFELNDRERH